ncbi:MAG: light-harvesting antenna LH1, beta subunit [Pseudomonadota bacterium]
MATDTSTPDTLSGLSASEAQEFHKAFILSFVGFTIIAIIAHFLVWSWRPWIPGPGGYEDVSAAETATQVAQFLSFLV